MKNKNVPPLEFYGNQIDRRTSNSGEETIGTSKFRSDLSQCLACSAINLFKLSSGTLHGFTTLMIGELYSENSEIKVTTDQLSWYGSYLFTIPVGALLTALLSDYIGNRKSVLLSLVIFILCWLLYYFVTDATVLLILQVLVGLTYSVPFISASSYVVEVAQPHLRSILMACGNLHMLCGSFFTMLLGTMMYWRTVALVNLAITIIGFVAIYFIPESPHWLASKGKIDEAEKSMAWIRGWTTPSAIGSELLSILKVKDDSGSVPQQSLTNNSKLKEKFKSYLQRSFIAPLAVVSYMFSIHALTGSGTIQTYTIVIFGLIQSPIDKHVSTVIYDALRILGAVVCIFIIQFTGKRVLMFGSLAVVILCYATIAIFSTLVKQEILSDLYVWIPTLAMQVATFSNSGGIDKIVYMYNVELFPTKFRNIGSGLGYFARSVFCAIVDKNFLFMVNLISLEGVITFFGIINLLAIASFYFLLPETNGKTLVEIEEYFIKGDKKSTKKSVEE